MSTILAPSHVSVQRDSQELDVRSISMSVHPLETDSQSVLMEEHVRTELHPSLVSALKDMLEVDVNFESRHVNPLPAFKGLDVRMRLILLLQDHTSVTVL